MRRVVTAMVSSALLGVLVGAVVWAVGVRPLQSAVLAVCVTAVAAVRGLIELQQFVSGGEQWRDRWSLVRGGARRDVRQLGWRLRAEHRRVHAAVLQRLRDLAHARLLRHGVDLDDPAAADAAIRLLGTTAHRVLTADGTTHVRYGAFLQTVDALERLAGPAATTSTATSTSASPTTESR